LDWSVGVNEQLPGLMLWFPDFSRIASPLLFPESRFYFFKAAFLFQEGIES